MAAGFRAMRLNPADEAALDLALRCATASGVWVAARYSIICWSSPGCRAPALPAAYPTMRVTISRQLSGVSVAL